MSVNMPLERRDNRTLLVFCDAIVFAIVIFVTLVLHPSSAQGFSWYVILKHTIISGGCIFGARFLFGVYKQIWRYGSIKSFTRLMAAQLVGAAGYLFIFQYILRAKNMTAVRAMFIPLFDFLGVYIMRVVYVYVYSIARNDSPLGRFCKRLVVDFARADVDSDDDNPGAVVPGGLFAPHAATPQGAPINVVQRVARTFDITGKVINIEQLTKGYINQTYRVDTMDDAGKKHSYTLQRINTNVFRDVDALMDNFALTTEHLKDKFLLPGHTNKGSIQTIKNTVDGKKYLKDDSGCWRMLTHFTGVYSLDIPDCTDTFYHAGKSFGMFIKCMADIPCDKVHEVIPNFHNTMSRYRDLEKVVEKDPVDRLKEVKPELEYVRELVNSGQLGIITEAIEKGEIPLRICHNDCNLNNILFDDETHLPVAVIDLDTVMPSTPLYDYGDSMRIGTNTAKDDEKDLSKVSCDLEMYENYARGYLEACGDMLTKRELELLPYSSIVISSEDGIRFLMDHIDGDTYYNIFYAGQNLDRCRTQLALVKDMMKKLPEIKKILRNIYEDLGLEAEIA